ncbi:MAG: FtsX-like permease family protein, partial [Rikenellaceae bacterium]
PMVFVTKGSFATSKSGQRLRTILLGVQFIISISLISSSIYMRVQHYYMTNYDIGFNKENILSVWMSYDVAGKSGKIYMDKMLLNTQIKDVTAIDGVVVAPSRMGWGRDIKGINRWFQCFPVAPNFLDFMGIKVVEGRDFTEDDNLKPEGAYIFNETAKNEFDITLEDQINGHNNITNIVGFCEDFNFKPLQYPLSPLALYVFGSEPWRPLSHIYIRTTKNADIKSVIDYMQSTMVELDPKITKDEVKVMFFDEELGENYYKEDRLSTLITTFSVISIIISLMGVFGLVMFETQYRRKEIGLRRVHGASQREILKMFNRKYIIIVLVCFVIAAPVTYYILSVWVSQFAYHAPISWWIFALALLLVLFITITTVTVRSYKSANEDPVSSIKTE